MVPFIDLAKQQERVRPEIEANIKSSQTWEVYSRARSF